MDSLLWRRDGSGLVFVFERYGGEMSKGAGDRARWVAALISSPGSRVVASVPRTVRGRKPSNCRLRCIILHHPEPMVNCPFTTFDDVEDEERSVRPSHAL